MSLDLNISGRALLPYTSPYTGASTSTIETRSFITRDGFDIDAYDRHLSRLQQQGQQRSSQDNEAYLTTYQSSYPPPAEVSAAYIRGSPISAAASRSESASMGGAIKDWQFENDLKLALEKSLHDQVHISLEPQSESPEELPTCYTCLEVLEKGTNLVFRRCGHGFHSACDFKWRQVKSTCPVCRI